MLHQVLVGVDVKPLALASAGSDRSPHQLKAYAATAMRRCDCGVQQEQVHSTIPGNVDEPHEIITVVSRQPSEGPLEHAVVALLLTALPGDAEQTLQGGQLDGLTDGVADGSHGWNGRATPTGTPRTRARERDSLLDETHTDRRFAARPAGDQDDPVSEVERARVSSSKGATMWLPESQSQQRQKGWPAGSR